MSQEPPDKRLAAVAISVLVTSLAFPTPARGQASRTSTAPTADAIQPLQQAREYLLREFEGFLEKPSVFAAKVRRECGGFPEGNLFPYLLPAYAYTNLALAKPNKYHNLALKRVGQLIDLAIPAVVRRVRPPSGRLENLKQFNRHATYLGQLNLALGCWRLIGGDDRYEAIHKHLSNILHEALVRRDGRPLESYPKLSWSFDTIPVLVSLQLRDRHTGEARSKDIIAKHLKWVQDRATDRELNLPYCRVNNLTGKGIVKPRGCDLSWRICLLAHIDRLYAARLYSNYVRRFWVRRDPFCGFAEWPGGGSGRQDLDSGPIYFGIGSTATAFGLGAARAMNDISRLRALALHAANSKEAMKMLIATDPRQKQSLTLGGKIDPDSRYYCGFLLGDTVLFYSVTWFDWSRPIRRGPSFSPAALQKAIEKLRPLHRKLGRPRPGDWLYHHKEPGQTFRQYLRCRPVRPIGKRRILYIQPLGQFDKTQRKIITLTADFMGRFFNLPVKISKDLPLSIIPAKARRKHPTWGDKQILSTYVLDKVLRPRLPADAAAYIALTTSDLWPGAGWNFVFGQASLAERIGVWSIYRNGNPEAGEKEFRLCLLRTIKTAVHETGHMFSMLHCTACECVMCGSNSRAESDRKPLWLCPECMAKVCWATRTDPVDRYAKLADFCKQHGLRAEQKLYTKSIQSITGRPPASSRPAATQASRRHR